jgi:iron complex transport system permease protein
MDGKRPPPPAVPADPSPANGRGVGQESGAFASSYSYSGSPLPFRRGRGWGWGLLFFLLASMILAAGFGQVHLPLTEVLRELRLGPSAGTILWALRLPRIGLAALVGASLAAAGVAFQALLRNELADPYLVGVSAGASVGAEATLLGHEDAALGGLGLPLASFGSAAAAMTIVYTLARRGGRVQVTSLLLAGVVISAFLGGVSSLLLQFSRPNDTQYLMYRLNGSLQDATLSQCGVTLGFLVVGFLILSVEARAMNVFALGEESAMQLGVEAERFKTILIVTGSLLTAATVAFAGIIGFVGLMSPHIARRLARTPDHRRVLPLAALCGAILMVWADTLARSVLPDGRELPVGIVTAFLGAPFFCYLLQRQWRG